MTAATKPLRADARRNRLRILQAAEAVFAEQGLATPIDEVAGRAGVGVGTLYRHFATKEALFEAIVSERLAGLLVHAEQLRESGEPATALFQFLRDLVAFGVAHQDLFDEMARQKPDHEAAKAELMGDLNAAIGRLLTAAQDCGAVRADVDVDDVTCLMVGTCMATTKVASGDGQRLVEVMCDGLRATPR